MTEDRIKKIAEEAQEAFWAKVVELLPEAKSGDFDALAAFAFDVECQKAVAHWVDCNVPERRP